MRIPVQVQAPLAFRFALLLLLTITISLRVCHAQTPEDLFRQTVQQWRSGKQSYEPWLDFASEILQRFEAAPTIEKLQQSPPPRLDLIGALEESILMIEKSTLHEGVNKPRDGALSKLYQAYGNTLLALSDAECHLLALDPHTLLIGSDTVQQQSKPSTHLCIENAENSLRNAVTLDATNTEAQSVLNQLLKEGAGGVHERKPKEFVAELFDSFADTFDEKLLKGLQYKVPKLIGQAVKELLETNNKDKQQYQNALDAGAGTGLAGRFLRPLVKQKMIGVDASQKMLDIAAKCTLTTGCGLETNSNSGENGNDEKDQQPLYDDLLVMDLEAMTVANTLGKSSSASSGFDLIVAADVLVYFGSLEKLLHTFQHVSIKGATLVVSCERTTPEEAPLGFRLLPSGRFAHTKQHVQEAAQKAGYQLKLYREIVPRMEKGEEVLGHLFGFELQFQQISASKEEL